MILPQAEFAAFLHDHGTRGVDAAAENNMVVSLTSYPARMGELHYCLYSLLRQTIKPQRLILWLGEEEFPAREQNLPEPVLALREKGLEIKWTKDIKQYKKLIPALKECGQNILVTADDDILYPENWLELLYTDYLRNDCRRMLYAHRAHRMTFDESGTLLGYNAWTQATENAPGASYVNFGTSGAGILFPPGALHHDVTNEQLFLQLAPFADDIFFWAMATLNDTPTRIVQDNIPEIACINGYNNEHALWNINRLGTNDLQLRNVLAHYPDVWVKIQAEQRIAMKKMHSAQAEHKEIDSAAYWESRYQQGGNSGAGSYNRLQQFKAEIINAFLDEHRIQSVIDFGVGDGSQLATLHVKDYLGFDVSESVLARLRATYSTDDGKTFLHTSAYDGHQAELALSLDVIYHLVEDEVFHAYMTRLFAAATKYVIIYSSNNEAQPGETRAAHVKHRKFTRWISTHQKDWKCIQYIKNKYPLTHPDGDQIQCSFSDFYIFEK